MSGGMPPSPKGREIKHVDGQPSDIIDRGNEIKKLGDQMLSAAETLDKIKNNTFAGGEQQGKAVEKLQDSIDDSAGTLKEAGHLYQPVGPVIAAYGQALETNKPRIDTSADTCGDLWSAYAALPGDKDGTQDADAGAPAPTPDGAAPGADPKAKEEAENNQAKKKAYDDWEQEADRFDTWYDAWEDAFEEASNGIEDKMAGKIKDGFWEVLDDIVSVLEVVATILFVAAIFLSGPFGLIAFAVASAVLLARTVQFCAGKCSAMDLAMAALDVVPFGKFGEIAGEVGKVGEEAGKLAPEASRVAKFAHGASTGFKQVKAGLRVASEFDEFGTPAVKKLPDIITSLHTGQTTEVFGKLGKYSNVAGAAAELHGAILQHGARIYSSVMTIRELPEMDPLDVFK